MRLSYRLLPYFVSRRARGPGTHFPPTFIFIIGFVLALWIDWQWPLPIVRESADIVRFVIGVAALVVGGWLFWWGMATFARARTGILLQQPASRLVCSGPYRWTRNPQYVGYLVGYFGLSVLANTLWPLLLLPVVLVLLSLFVIEREEKYLRGVFGPEYVDYCRRVSRWL